MKARFTYMSGVLFGLILFLTNATVTTAYAGLDIDFGAAVQIGDNTDVYFAVSSRYYDQDEQNVRKWNRQCADSDDLAVALFISRHGHESPDKVFALRSNGMSWWEISVRLGVPAEVWFVPVKKDPGPPYGKAYGHWKKHGKNSPAKMDLSDADAQNLVAVRMLHEYYGVSVEVAMEWRSSGRNLEDITAGAYRNRHGKNKNSHDKVAVHSDDNQGKNKGGGKGKK